MPEFQQPKLDEYESLRNRAKQQGNAQRDEAMETLRRRLASQGMLQSGAYNAASQQTEEAANRNTNEAVQNVDFAEKQELQRRQEMKEARNYQTQERVASQDFSSSEAQKGRLFSKELFDADMSFKQQVQASTVRFAELDAAFREKEFEVDKETNSFNKYLALRQAGVVDPADVQTILSRYQGVKSNL